MLMQMLMMPLQLLAEDYDDDVISALMMKIMMLL
jgi:hypothetical protein